MTSNERDESREEDPFRGSEGGGRSDKSEGNERTTVACLGEGFRGVKVYIFEDLGLELESSPRKTFQERDGEETKPKENFFSMDSKNENVMCVNQRSGYKKLLESIVLKKHRHQPSTSKRIYTHPNDTKCG